ncbi:Innexin [Trinorchestia longiramus]|nr:Innexin [Trinorchestia longiramus]
MTIQTDMEDETTTAAVLPVHQEETGGHSGEDAAAAVLHDAAAAVSHDGAAAAVSHDAAAAVSHDAAAAVSHDGAAAAVSHDGAAAAVSHDGAAAAASHDSMIAASASPPEGVNLGAGVWSASGITNHRGTISRRRNTRNKGHRGEHSMYTSTPCKNHALDDSYIDMNGVVELMAADGNVKKKQKLREEANIRGEQGQHPEKMVKTSAKVAPAIKSPVVKECHAKKHDKSNSNKRNDNANCFASKFKLDNNNNNNDSNKTSSQNNSSNFKVGGGDMKWDLLSSTVKQLCYSIGLLKRSNGPGYTLESLCLQFHYRFLVLFFYVIHAIVALNWYVTDEIVCYQHGAAQAPQKGHYRDICLSYPYVLASRVTGESEQRQYLLFYRWVPYSFLLVSCAAYTLRVALKSWEDSRLASLCKDVWNQRSDYDANNWSRINNRVLHFLMTKQASASHYCKWILLHVFANLVVVAAAFYFNFVLQGSFMHLVPEVVPELHRNPINFDDPLSMLFPPFVECQITLENTVVLHNEYNFGCHLTLMEL